MRAPYIDGGDKRLCTGCSACAYACPTGAIAMTEDDCGFVYPEVDGAKCVGCGKCLKACHMADPDGLKSESEPKAYGAYVKDRGQLMKSASGGVATAIALRTVEDGGIAYGCVAHREIVRHERLTTPDAVERSRGSKYVQSDISGAIPKIAADLGAGVQVTFVGTPCQCAALKRLFGERDDLLLVDLVCEGVPSQRMYADFLDELERECGECVADFRFRDKRRGWGTKNPTVVAGDGVPAKRQCRSFEYPYYWLFQKGLILRDSCYACPYACQHRVGDVTAGDFWGAETSGLGYSLEELKGGVSCALPNTKSGADVLECLSGSIDLRPVPLGIVARSNGCLVRSSSCDRCVRASVLAAYRKRGVAGMRERYREMFRGAARAKEAIAARLLLAVRVAIKRVAMFAKREGLRHAG